jgi:hypothetical protein
MPTTASPTPASVPVALQRLDGRAWGIAFGLLSGLTLFLMTLVLVVRNGPGMGAHLKLLGVFFPGYRVSLGGAFIGFVYAFVVGYALGRLIGWTYNTVSRVNEPA